MQLRQTNSSWSILTANSYVAFQVVGSLPVEIGLGSNTVNAVVGFSYYPGSGDRGLLTELFPTSVGNTVWGRSSAPSSVVVG